MKKLTLKQNAFNRGEVLTRAQLKKIMGGDGSGSGSTFSCQCLTNYQTFSCNDFGDCLTTATSTCGSAGPNDYYCARN